MAEDRDRYKPKTPPAGVRAQTARPVPESWEDDNTRPGEDELRTLNRRVRRASKAVAGLRTDVAGIRLDMGAMGKTIGDRVASVDDRLDKQTDKLADKLIEVLAKDRAVTNEIESNAAKHRLVERSADGELRRWSARQIVAFIVGAAGTVLTAVLAAHQC